MRKIQNFSIVSTFICLWLALYLDQSLEQYLACFLILSIGILHGANDIKIINKVYRHKNYSLYKTLILYVTIVLAGAIMFYFLPAIALLFFIIISGYHFGEQHFHYIKTPLLSVKQLLFLSYGLVVIFLMLTINAKESTIIINQIVGIAIDDMYLKYALLLCAVCFVVSFFILRKAIKSYPRELFYLVVFSFVFSVASLIWAFAIYFVIWHSIPSLMDQIKYLYREITKITFFKYLKSSFIYWLVSVISLYLFFTFLINDNDMFYALFFSFLAAITFPHVLVMTKIFKH